MFLNFIKIATTATLLSLSLGTVTQAGTIEVLVNGLNSPRKLAFSPDNQLYFTEAGIGSSMGACLILRGTEYCYGENGTVKRWTNGGVENIITNLPSLAISSDGSDSTGAHDIVFDNNGNALVLLGWGGGDQRSSNSAFAPLGTLIRLDSLNVGTNWSVVADLVAFEETNNPDGNQGNAIDSNPFALILDGNKVVIADAGANDVLSGTPNGNNYDLSLEAVFPNRSVPPFTMESVPTAIAKGADGADYVGELTGFPFPMGGANIYRLDPLTQNVTVWATGFTNIIDLEFDGNNNLFVLEYTTNSILSGDSTGSLIKISPNGYRQTLLSGTDGLIFPTGLAIGQDGYVYIANNGNTAGGGQLVRTAATVSEPNATFGLFTLSILGIISIFRRKV